MMPRANGASVRALFVGLVLLFLLPSAACTKKAPQYELVHSQDGRVAIPLSIVNDGRVHHYTYKKDGKNINFFIRTDGHGHLHAHFDACYSCFKYKLGYVWKGHQVVCIACRIGYDLDNVVWDYIGACAPIPLSSRVMGDCLVIKQKWLEKGGKYF